MKKVPIRIGQKPGHGFESPLGLLSDCHRRIEQFLEALITVARRPSARALSPSDRAALEGALDYFANAAPKHTADEEDSLFPRLRASADPDIRRALAVVDTLERDHREADQHHRIVDALGRRWLAAGSLTADERHELGNHVQVLQAIYLRHIAIEDRDLFPAAGRALGEADLREIGREMAARRVRR